jgi:hypothetical protein
MIVVEYFDVGNGVLGLDRNIYLSLVKLLESSTVRKVWLSVFILFNFLFFCDSTWESFERMKCYLQIKK